MPDPQPHQCTDDPTSLQRLGASAQMTSKSTMSEKLALATKITKRTGLFTDPRSWDEKLMADMAPEFAAVTLELISLQTSYDFVIDYPHGEVVISQVSVNSEEPVSFYRTECLYCSDREEHDHEETRERFPLTIARIVWKGKDVAIIAESGGPGEESVNTFVNGQFFFKGKFKLLRPDDNIEFRESPAEKPFFQLDVDRIAYGGLQPTHRSKDFEENELVRLHLLGTQQSLDARKSLDMPNAIVIAVAMVVLSGLIMFFFQVTPSNAVN